MAPPLVLNLGCGLSKIIGAVNVDAFAVCEPDVVHDLNVFPYPWADGVADEVKALHVLEHLDRDKWFDAFREMVRVTKEGGRIVIAVPDESSTTALTYRDHNTVFSKASWHGCVGYGHGTNAWAVGELNGVPVRLVEYLQTPYPEYQWMMRWCPWLLRWCAKHLRNFIHEQVFVFQKIRL